MMRPSNYARKSPEAREGFAVFAVRLVLVVMARAYAGDFCWRQRIFGMKLSLNMAEPAAVGMQSADAWRFRATAKLRTRLLLTLP
jgi:hypothetical protein